eukprot:6210367-Pleurochrysis_carterae.AAC.1
MSDASSSPIPIWHTRSLCAAMRIVASLRIPNDHVLSQMRNGVRNESLAAGAKALIGTKTVPKVRLAATKSLPNPGRARPTRALL